jgi:hypothetical protein
MKSTNRSVSPARGALLGHTACTPRRSGGTSVVAYPFVFKLQDEPDARVPDAGT